MLASPASYKIITIPRIIFTWTVSLAIIGRYCNNAQNIVISQIKKFAYDVNEFLFQIGHVIKSQTIQINYFCSRKIRSVCNRFQNLWNAPPRFVKLTENSFQNKMNSGVWAGLMQGK